MQRRVEIVPKLQDSYPCHRPQAGTRRPRSRNRSSLLKNSFVLPSVSGSGAQRDVLVVFWHCFRALPDRLPGRRPLFQQARSLMVQTRLVPILSPKTPLEYPGTQSLRPSPNTFSHEGFGTKPGQDLVHPFVWPHQRFTAWTSYLKQRRLARLARSRRGREATPRPDVGGGGDEETQPNQYGKGEFARSKMQPPRE